MSRPSKSKVFMFLDLVAEGLIDQISPKYDPKSGYEYCSSLEELGISCDEAMEVIEELVEIGLFRKEVYDRVASCSKCGSEVFLVRAKCPYCRSLKFYRSVVIEHLFCGHVGLEAEFLTKQGKFVCPKCRRELKGLGVDSIRVADVQKCEGCGEVFSVPSIMHQCLKCGYENKDIELRPKEVYKYALVPESVKREGPVLKLYDAIRSRKVGYEVLGPYAKVKGSSGVELEFNMVLRDPYSGSILAVIEVVEELDQDKLLALFAKSHEVGARRVIVVHEREVDEKVLSLASGLKVKLLKLR
ncbi:MAG: hypothetical protein NZ992_03260, partial [Candidatus Korarchaeum sp.]|nr:hypothetical protein [Candidatus Korarchaeum sp.]